MTSQPLRATCVIVGGGPAGIMLGFLLARAGVSVLVLEKHRDFLRDFRGDTIHPSTLEVMHELGLLEETLPTAIEILAPRGRCVAISYHSGEDRIVKAAFAQADTGGCVCPPGLPCACGAVPIGRLLFRGARRPTPEERSRNRRAESARLRAVERLDGDVAESLPAAPAGDPGRSDRR